MAAHRQPLEVFISYAPADEQYLLALESHLALLQRQRTIEPWHARKVSAGQDWRDVVDVRLETANIILLLVSSDFIASDHLYDVEVKRALERRVRGHALVVCVLLRSCDWESAPFGEFCVLPKNRKPISQWQDRDAALTEVVKAIRGMVEPRRTSARRSSVSRLAAVAAAAAMVLMSSAFGTHGTDPHPSVLESAELASL
jgi:hypothetical protein